MSTPKSSPDGAVIAHARPRDAAPPAMTPAVLAPPLPARSERLFSAK